MNTGPKRVPRKSRSVPLDADAVRNYFRAVHKTPTAAFSKQIRRGKIDPKAFLRAMRENRIPAREWYQFLPEGGVPEAEVPEPGRAEDHVRVLHWFPNSDHLAVEAYSSLTWAGAGSNDAIIAMRMPNPRGGADIPVLPLDRSGPLPALQIHFSHRSKGLNAEHSWWSAIIGFSPGANAPEWKTVDFSKYGWLKIQARAYLHPTTAGEVVLPLLVRLEDENVIPGRPLHSSTSWCRKPLQVTQWSRPEWLSLSQDFDWGPNAFWSKAPEIDRRNVLQITFGLDGSVPDCEGYIEIQAIELHGPKAHLGTQDIATEDERDLTRLG